MSSFQLLYTTGVHQEIYTFETLLGKQQWSAEVQAIKAESSAAFNKKEQDGLTDEVREMCDNWMAHVKSFAQIFGENKTPMDIKWALNSAEKALEVPVTQWVNPPQDSLFE